MDRISTLRNVEDALAAFERGEIDLSTMEARVQGALRTFATEYPEDGTRAYRASGDPRAEGLVVLADSRSTARERVVALLQESDGASDALRFTVSPVD
ncbi:MAG: hypothetical protein ABEJ55_03605 [Halanaeroarchaeum sp.]